MNNLVAQTIARLITVEVQALLSYTEWSSGFPVSDCSRAALRARITGGYDSRETAKEMSVGTRS